MMDRQHGRIVWECDSCADTLETETGDFQEALRIMRSSDWRANQVGRDWVHTCFDCGQEADRNRRHTRR